MKIVINDCYGCFGLSDKAMKRYTELRGSTAERYDCNIDREDEMLIQTIMELGKDANHEFSDLKIVEVPDGVEYDIGESGGMEHIAEVHRTWDGRDAIN